MNNLISILENLSQKQGKVVNINCGFCGELERSTSYCRTCGYTCNNCSKAHSRKNAMFINHEMISNEAAEQECKTLVDRTKFSVVELSKQFEISNTFEKELQHIDRIRGIIKGNIEHDCATFVEVITRNKRKMIGDADALFNKQEDGIRGQMDTALRKKMRLEEVQESLESIVAFQHDDELKDKIMTAEQTIASCMEDTPVLIKLPPSTVWFISGMTPDALGKMDFGLVVEEDDISHDNSEREAHHQQGPSHQDLRAQAAARDARSRSPAKIKIKGASPAQLADTLCWKTL